MLQYGFFRRLHRKFKDRLNRFTVKLPPLLFDKKLTDKPLPPYTEINSILFILDDVGLGDCLVTSIAFRELKKYIPNLKLDAIASTKTEGLLKAYSYIDNVYVAKYGIIPYMKLGRALSANRYDIVIHSRGFLRVREFLLLHALNPGYFMSGAKTLKLATLLLQSVNNHISGVSIHILNALQITDLNDTYAIPSDPQREQKVADFLSHNHIDNYIVVNFWAGVKRRTLTEENIYLLMDNIVSTYKNRNIMLLGFPGVLDILNEICAKYENTYAYDTLNIFDSIAIVRHAELVITPDTSIVHIASGFDKPIIAFYINPQESLPLKSGGFWAPKATKQKVFTASFEVNELDFRNLDLTIPSAQR